MPCQVQALNNFIKHENLLTIDIICHGAPSKFVFDTAIKERFNSELDRIDFRNKKKGWVNYYIEYKCKNGYVKSNEVRNDAWFTMYLKNVFLNTSCYNCKFCILPRSGDISLGDFWGINFIDAEFSKINNNRGVSTVIINNQKGEKAFLNVKNEIISKLEPIELACNYNPRIEKGSYGDGAISNRKVFFKSYFENNIRFKDRAKICNYIDKCKSVILKLIKRIIND